VTIITLALLEAGAEVDEEIWSQLRCQLLRVQRDLESGRCCSEHRGG
jgi:hypothetical protein